MLTPTLSGGLGLSLSPPTGRSSPLSILTPTRQLFGASPTTSPATLTGTHKSSVSKIVSINTPPGYPTKTMIVGSASRTKQVKRYHVHLVYLQVSRLVGYKSRSAETPPIRCFIHGPVGTGKTQVIKALLDLFKCYNKPECVKKAAFMGGAARVIDGFTLHSLLGIAVHQRASVESHDKRTAKLVARFAGVWYLIIDEVSMVSQELLSEISKSLNLATQSKDASVPFGGLSVIFMGDFHQFSPNGGTALYNHDKVKPGRALWKSLTDAFIFHRQQRQKDDAKFLDTLMRIRAGNAKEIDRVLLSSRVVGDRSGLKFTDPKFQNATIITSRNSVRQALNIQLAERNAQLNHQKLLVILSQTQAERKGQVIRRSIIAQELLDIPDSKVEKVAGKLPLLPGIRLQLRHNIATELGRFSEWCRRYIISCDI